MAIEVEDWELKTILANPPSFYEAINSHKEYTPKAGITAGDSEFLVTDIVAKGCVVAACMVHRSREAHLMLFDSDSLTSLRESLEQRQIELNSLKLSSFRT